MAEPHMQGDSITVESLPSKMEFVSRRHLPVRVAYLQGERHPVLEPSEAELLWTYPSAAFHPVSRHPAQTSGIRKRLPFSLCIRPEVTPPL